MTSLKEKGQLEPVQIGICLEADESSKSIYLYEGNHRLRASVKLGIEYVEFIVIQSWMRGPSSCGILFSNLEDIESFPRQLFAQIDNRQQ